MQAKSKIQSKVYHMNQKQHVHQLDVAQTSFEAADQAEESIKTEPYIKTE